MTPEMCHRREIWSNKLPMVSVKRKNAVQITSCYLRLFNSVGDFIQGVHFIFLHEQMNGTLKKESSRYFSDKISNDHVSISVISSCKHEFSFKKSTAAGYSKTRIVPIIMAVTHHPTNPTVES